MTDAPSKNNGKPNKTLSEEISYKIGCRRAMLSFANYTREQFEQKVLRPHLDAIAFHKAMISQHEDSYSNCRERVEQYTQEIISLRKQQKEQQQLNGQRLGESSARIAETKKQKRREKLARMTDEQRDIFLLGEELEATANKLQKKLNLDDDAFSSLASKLFNNTNGEADDS